MVALADKLESVDLALAGADFSVSRDCSADAAGLAQRVMEQWVSLAWGESTLHRLNQHAQKLTGTPHTHAA